MDFKTVTAALAIWSASVLFSLLVGKAVLWLVEKKGWL